VKKRTEFLQEQAVLMAQKLHTDKEKALKAIIKAEQSKSIFRSIHDITGKPQASITQVDFSDPHRDPTTLITLTTKEEVEHAILTRNQKHSKQSLATPFASVPLLLQAVSPEWDNNLDSFLNGTFIDQPLEHIPINDTEKQWIRELQRKIHSQINLSITTDDFKRFFAKKQERKSSSPSGRHMGHYKVFLD
jgi:hypothetical protein